MKQPIQKVKSFAIGLSMAGMAAIATSAPQGGQSSCGGSCTQCYACGLTALPLVIWLAAKRWQPVLKIRDAVGSLVAHRK